MRRYARRKVTHSLASCIRHRRSSSPGLVEPTWNIEFATAGSFAVNEVSQVRDSNQNGRKLIAGARKRTNALFACTVPRAEKTANSYGFAVIARRRPPTWKSKREHWEANHQSHDSSSVAVSSRQDKRMADQSVPAATIIILLRRATSATTGIRQTLMCYGLMSRYYIIYHCNNVRCVDNTLTTINKVWRLTIYTLPALPADRAYTKCY